MKSFNKFVFLLFVMMFAILSCTQTPKTTVKITDLSTVLGRASEGDTIYLTQYPDITNFKATIDKKLILQGSSVSTDMLGGAITIKVSGVVFRNVSNVDVAIDEVVANGSFEASDSFLNKFEVYGGGIATNHIVLNNTSVKDCYICKEVKSDGNNPEYLGIEMNGSTVITKVTMLDTCVAFYSKDISQTLRIKDVAFTQVESDYSANIAYGSNILVHSGSTYCTARYSDSAFNDAYVHPQLNICVEKGSQSSKVSKTFFKQACKFILGNVNSGTINDDDSHFNKIIEGDCTADIKNMVDQITITFDGGDDATGDMSPIKVVLDGYFKIPECTYIYGGHKFIDWTIIGNSSVQCCSGDLVKFGRSTTLKANWLDAYTITYIDKDTTFDGLWKDNYKPVTVFTINDSVVLPKEDDINKPGYELIGWYNNKDLSGKSQADWGSNQFNKNITLYAKWKYIAEADNVKIRNGNRQMQLRWTNPNDANFDHVSIECKGEGGTTKNVSGAAGQNMTCDFTGLTNGDEYDFEIVCYDKNNNVSDALPVSQYCGNYFADDGSIVVKGIKYSKTKLVTVTDVTVDIKGSGTEGAFPEGRNVTLSPYCIGAYLVTQELYEAVRGYNPSTNNTDKMLPVECVTILDAQAFLDELSDLFGFDSLFDSSSDSYIGFDGFRLASEAEWEFAARGADQSSDLWNMNYSGSNDVTKVAWFSGNSDKKTHPVGELGYLSADLPIYDMCGNLWEWCAEIYQPQLSKGNFVNPFNYDGKQFVLRGGSYINEDVKITTRSSEFYSRSNKMLGFRLARNFN